MRAWFLGLGLFVFGCSAASKPGGDDFGDDTGGGDDDGGLVIDGGDDGGLNVDSGGGGEDTGGDGSTTCAKTSAEAKKPPIDVIMAIDQSGSMSDDIANVKTNINKLSDFLKSTGLDYRVVMIASWGAPHHTSSYGKQFEVCVPPPLGGATCGANNPPIFRHVNRNVQSLDALRLILYTYDQTSDPLKWSDVLRKEALKVIIPITDDDSRQLSTTYSCSDADYADATKSYCNPTAEKFDELLLKRGSGQFGSKAARNYVAYPIIGAAAYPSEAKCGTNAVNNGQQYINLVKLTKGKWFPICLTNFAPVFTEIAKNVATRVACVLTIPEPPTGEKIDHEKVNVTWTPSGGGTPVTIPQDNSKPCESGANGWQYDAEKKKVILCGDACAKVQADSGSKVAVEFGCKTQVK